MTDHWPIYEDKRMFVARPSDTFHYCSSDRRSDWDRLCKAGPVMTEEEVLRYLRREPAND